jgi:hypothetical protein
MGEGKGGEEGGRRAEFKREVECTRAQTRGASNPKGTHRRFQLKLDATQPLLDLSTPQPPPLLSSEPTSLRRRHVTANQLRTRHPYADNARVSELRTCS